MSVLHKFAEELLADAKERLDLRQENARLRLALSQITKVPGLPHYIAVKYGCEANGTHLQGEIECSYADLVAVFGKPNSGGDGYAEWHLTFTKFSTYDEPATIYNCKNYLKEDGLPTEQITDWHIGGKSGEVVGYVASMLIAHYRSLIR